MAKFKRRNPHCENCDLCEEASTVYVPPRGSKKPDLLVVSGHIGETEDEEGRCLTGRNEEILEELLEQSGVDLDKVAYTSSVKCIAWSAKGVDKPNKKQISACHEYLIKEIQHFKPKAILTLGGEASQSLLQKSVLKHIRGQKFDKPLGVRKVRSRKTGKVKTKPVDIPVIPTHHPIAMLVSGKRAASAQADFLSDASFARSLYDKSGQKEDETEYTLLNDEASLKDYVDKVTKLHKKGKLELGCISADLETEDLYPWIVDRRIWTIQVSHRFNQAVCIPVHHAESWFNKSKKNMAILAYYLKKLFRLPVTGQNFRFDSQWLHTKFGIKMKRGQVVFDTMLADHCYTGGAESNKLEHMVTRYLGKPNPKMEMHHALAALPPEERDMGHVDFDLLVRYGCGDADNTLQLTAYLREALEEEDRLQAFLDLYMYPWQFFTDMQYNGVRYDLDLAGATLETFEKMRAEAASIITESSYMKKWRKVTRKVHPKRKALRKTHRGLTKWDEVLDEDGETRYINLDVPKFEYKEFNPGSWQHLYALLYDVMQLPMVKEERGRHGYEFVRSSDQEACQKLGQITFVEDDEEGLRVIRDGILQWKFADTMITKYAVPFSDYVFNQGEASTLFSSRFEKYPDLWRLHATLNQNGTVTGRLSASEPPLHGTPWKSLIKENFVPDWGEDGLFIHGDYSQMELRVLALLSRDEGYLSIFSTNPTGHFAQFKGDIHRFVASQVYGVSAKDVTDDQRRAAKAVSFGIIYGASAKKMADDNDMTVAEAQKILDDYYELFPNVAKWMEKMRKEARKQGYLISPNNRLLTLDGIHTDPTDPRAKMLIAEAERCAVNYPIQGSASDICSLSSAHLHYRFRKKKMKTRSFVLVHDANDMNCYVPELLDVLVDAQKVMSRWPMKRFDWVDIPMKVDFEIGSDWRNMMECEYDLKTGVMELKGDVGSWPVIKRRLKRHYKLTNLKTTGKKVVKSLLESVPSGIPQGLSLTKILPTHTKVTKTFNIAPK